MALSRDCRHGRQIGKCADCDLDHMEMAADAEARRVDELTALRKQDEALIRQLVEALEAGLKEVIATGENEGVLFGPDQHVDEKLQEAITAARARLAPPPPTA